jgi:transcription elongation factor Elf1
MESNKINKTTKQFCPFCEEETYLNILDIDYDFYKVTFICLQCGEIFKKPCYSVQELEDYLAYL